MSADLLIEKQYSNYVIAGVDEVGRGAWAGPVVVSAVIIDQTQDCSGIADSKSLSFKKRQEMSNKIKNEHIYAIASACSEEIDRFNINNAIKLAIERAIESLPKKPSLILLDGNYSFDLSVKKLNIVKGDTKSISIAAASIVAKQYRDDIMALLGKDFPQYMWDKNVGYGTAIHRKVLEERGITKHHRLSYKPIRDFIDKTIVSAKL